MMKKHSEAAAAEERMKDEIKLYNDDVKSYIIFFGLALQNYKKKVYVIFM